MLRGDLTDRNVKFENKNSVHDLIYKVEQVLGCLIGSSWIKTHSVCSVRLYLFEVAVSRYVRSVHKPAFAQSHAIACVCGHY